jgi:hypothetical protein
MTFEPHNITISLRHTKFRQRGQLFIPLSPTIGVSLVELEDSPQEMAIVRLKDGKDGSLVVDSVISDSVPCFTLGDLLATIQDAITQYIDNE